MDLKFRMDFKIEISATMSLCLFSSLPYFFNFPCIKIGYYPFNEFQ